MDLKVGKIRKLFNAIMNGLKSLRMSITLLTRYVLHILTSSILIVDFQIHGASVELHKGLYCNKILQKIVNAMWFTNKHDEGIKYLEYFKPFPTPALALVLTTVSVCSFIMPSINQSCLDWVLPGWMEHQNQDWRCIHCSQIPLSLQHSHANTRRIWGAHSESPASQ